MTPQEFKTWFLGFALTISVRPSEMEWLKIKAKVSEMDLGVEDRQFTDLYRRANNAWR